MMSLVLNNLPLIIFKVLIHVQGQQILFSFSPTFQRELRFKEVATPGANSSLSERTHFGSVSLLVIRIVSLCGMLYLACLQSQNS